MKGRSIAAGLAAALLASCATKAPPVRIEPQPKRVPPPATPEPPVASPAVYLARAASYDQLMVRAAAVAGRADPRLAGLARRLSEEHVGLGAQLSLAGRRLNLVPRPELLPLHRQWLSEMEAAPDVGVAYLRLARRVHQNSYAMHARFARQGTSPTLRPVARNAADVEARHWAELAR